MAENYDGVYQNFVFMAGWRDVLEGFEKEFGVEYAREALWNLMLVGTLEGQEPITDKQSIRGFVNGCIKPVVKSSNKNYNKNKENGMKGGRPSIVIDVELANKLHDGGMTWKAVAKELGVSDDTLRRARQESEKPQNRKIETEKPQNPPEFFVEKTAKVLDDEKSRKTAKPKNYYQEQGFTF